MKLLPFYFSVVLALSSALTTAIVLNRDLIGHNREVKEDEKYGSLLDIGSGLMDDKTLLGAMGLTADCKKLRWLKFTDICTISFSSASMQTLAADRIFLTNLNN